MLKSLKRLLHGEDRSKASTYVKTDISTLGSQGLRTAEDESAAFVHCSTTPPQYYLYTYDCSAMNMDRGGFGHAKNGTNYACVFDGVTSGGRINAYAAQAFTDYVMDWLAEHHTLFCFGAQHSAIDIARSALESAAGAANNPAQADRAWQAEGGSATGAFVSFARLSEKSAKLYGASIGDAAVIAVDVGTGLAQQLNPVVRRHAQDTGGMLTMCVGVDGPVWTFAVEVAAAALVILTTDGFTDNVCAAELDRIVPFVVCSPLFDGTVASECDLVVRAEDPRQPSLADLRAMAKGVATQALASVSCEMAARRLFNYVEWVTRPHYRQEEIYYKLCLEARQTVEQEKRHAVEAEVAQMAARRKAAKRVVKTDDAMIIVLRPFHSGASGSK